MDVMGLLKKAFPKPNIPQKRYLIVAGLAVYWAMKVYVTITPNPADDVLPDLLKGAVVEFYSKSDDDGLKFGEGA